MQLLTYWSCEKNVQLSDMVPGPFLRVFTLCIFLLSVFAWRKWVPKRASPRSWKCILLQCWGWKQNKRNRRQYTWLFYWGHPSKWISSLKQFLSSSIYQRDLHQSTFYHPATRQRQTSETEDRLFWRWLRYSARGVHNRYCMVI